MRATSLVLIGVSQIHVVLNILINRNYSYCNTMYKWINKRFCLSVCLSVGSCVKVLGVTTSPKKNLLLKMFLANFGFRVTL